MENKNGNGDAVKVLVEQYKENMKTLIREGKLNHGRLEQHLSFVIGSVNEEIKKITEELIKEEEFEKKTATARFAGKKQKSMQRRRK